MLKYTWEPAFVINCFAPNLPCQHLPCARHQVHSRHEINNRNPAKLARNPSTANQSSSPPELNQNSPPKTKRTPPQPPSPERTSPSTVAPFRTPPLPPHLRPKRLPLPARANPHFPHQQQPRQQQQPQQPHPYRRLSVLDYLPAGYRDRLLRFRLDTLPRYKRGLQSRIYRFIVERQRRKRERRLRLVAARGLVRARWRWLGLGLGLGSRLGLGKGLGKGQAGSATAAGPSSSSSAGRGAAAHAHAPGPGQGQGGRGDVDGGGGAVSAGRAARTAMQSQYGGGGSGSGSPGGYGYSAYGSYGTGVGSGASTPPGERGSRRKKLAAVAGSVYRAGVAAASELKEQYNNTRIRGVDTTGAQVSIPGAFPEVSIITKGDEQMVLFPTYAKKHVREFTDRGGLPPGQSFQAANAAQMGMSEREYWNQEWARAEDEKAVVDVDVRGWIYMPSKGPMTRRNRMLVGLARRLSGVPAPTVQSDPTASSHEEYEEMKEEQRIAREAREIEKRGQDEKEVANRGGYSETPGGLKGNNQVSGSAPTSPTLSGRTPTMSQTDMTEAELAVANANLMARLGPFMTTPLVQIPITIFFYNAEQSRSHTVMTDDSGHFNARVALEFVPTDVRVLANESISTTKPVEITGSRGVSLISDVDDTIKHSNISMGAREIFRNALVRDLADLTVDGVKEWYHKMHDMGVKMHYCSNSPWQLYPVLATFLHTAGLPQGSMHLKHYSGMLQGIFEPVAERKKGTLEAIIRDFPERKFLLVGDSGEADLEVYTELAVANPDRILAVFVRDVTTPDQTGFFDSSYSIDSGQRNRQGSTRARAGGQAASDDLERRPQLPPRATAPPTSSGPIMGTLIDFDESEPAGSTRTGSLQDLANLSTPGSDVPSRKPPPRPAKPAALRSTPSDTSTNSQRSTPTGPDPSQGLPLRPRTSAGTSPNTLKPTPPPPPPPRRRGTAPMVQHPQQPRSSGYFNSDVPELEPLPAVSGGYPAGISETGTPPNSAAAAAGVNKKVGLWLQRLARAHEILDAQGVKLYTWRKGDDVIAEAEGIVKEAMRKMDFDR